MVMSLLTKSLKLLASRSLCSLYCPSAPALGKVWELGGCLIPQQAIYSPLIFFLYLFLLYVSFSGHLLCQKSILQSPQGQVELCRLNSWLERFQL